MLTAVPPCRNVLQANAPTILGTDPRLLAELLRLPSGFESWENLGLAAAAVLLVTGARLQLMQVRTAARCLWWEDVWESVGCSVGYGYAGSVMRSELCRLHGQ